jgi:hypothetical protein
MTKLRDCLAGKASSNDIDELDAMYEDFLRTENPELARKKVLDAIQAQKKEVARRGRIEAVVKTRILQERELSTDGWGKHSYLSYMNTILEHDGGNAHMDVAHKQDAILGSYMAEIEDFLWDSRDGFVRGDLRRKYNKEVRERLVEVVKASYDETTTDVKAVAFAKAIRKVNERARNEFNAAGGNIGKLNWQKGLTASHDAEKMLAAGKEKWIEFVMQNGILNRDAMKNWKTGRRLTDAEMRDGLSLMYNDNVTRGWASRDPGTHAGKSALFSKHGDSRFLHFDGSEGWLKYNKEFGQVDAYESILTHYRTMSRDTGAMAVLGPNPAATMKWLADLTRKDYETGKLKINTRAEDMDELGNVMKRTTRDMQPGSDAIADRLTEAHKALDKRRLKVARQETNKAFQTKAMQKKALAANKAAVSKVNAIEAELVAKIPRDIPVEHQLMIENELAEHFNKLHAFQDVPERDSIGMKHVEKKIRDADNLFKIITESGNVHDQGLANRMGALRHALTAASLGSSPISALSDNALSMWRRYVNGMPIGRHMVDMVKMFRQLPRRQQVRAGMLLDRAANIARTNDRFAMAGDTKGKAAFVSDRVLGIIGLTGMTQAAKWVWSKEVQGTLADSVGKTFAQLHPDHRLMMTRHGISPADWDNIRTADVFDDHGSDFLRPNEIAKLNLSGAKLTGDELDPVAVELSHRYVAMIQRERQLAVPEPGQKIRRAMTGGAMDAGTPGGEFWRSAGQFSSFAITFTMNLLRASQQRIREVGVSKAGAEIAGLSVALTTIGTLSIWAYDLANGRTPSDPSDPRTWGRGFLKAGGGTVIGDFLVKGANANRFGGSLAESMGGPTVGKVGDAWRAAGDMEAGRYGSAMKRMSRMLPGQNIWYLRLALERLIFDNLQRWMDGDRAAEKSFRRKEKRAKDETGSDYLVPPGSWDITQ